MIADADGAEQALVARVGGDEFTDAFPEQEQGREALLIFLADEGATEFEGGAEGAEEALVEVEERSGVEGVEGDASGAASAGMAAGGVSGSGEAIGSGEFAARGIPHKEMEVVGVEGVEVARAAGAFARGAEGDFAEAADFVEHQRHLVCGGEVDAEITGFDELAMGW